MTDQADYLLRQTTKGEDLYQQGVETNAPDTRSSRKQSSLCYQDRDGIAQRGYLGKLLPQGYPRTAEGFFLSGF